MNDDKIKSIEIDEDEFDSFIARIKQEIREAICSNGQFSLIIHPASETIGMSSNPLHIGFGYSHTYPGSNVGNSCCGWEPLLKTNKYAEMSNDGNEQ